MRKISSPASLQTELRRLVDYTQESAPSRRVLASRLRVLAEQVAPRDVMSAGPGDIEKAMQDLTDMCRELYQLAGRIESAANRAKKNHPQFAAKVLEDIDRIDSAARRLSTDVDEYMGFLLALTVDRFKAASKRRALRERAVAYKGGRCEICGYARCSSALDFHHVDPWAKDFAISSRLTSFRAIQRELDKTVLLCATCHREVHDGQHPGYLDEGRRGELGGALEPLEVFAEEEDQVRDEQDDEQRVVGKLESHEPSLHRGRLWINL